MSWSGRPPSPGRATLALALTLVGSLPATSTVRAAEPQPASSRSLLARHELWLSLSATLLTAGIAGSYALKVSALNDRIDSLVLNSTERPQLAQNAVNARRLVWGFGSAASLFAITSVLVLIFQPETHGNEPQPAQELSPSFSANELGVLYRRRF